MLNGLQDGTAVPEETLDDLLACLFAVDWDLAGDVATDLGAKEGIQDNRSAELRVKVGNWTELLNGTSRRFSVRSRAGRCRERPSRA